MSTLKFRMVVVKPHQAGWLRRPECDQPGIEAWEMPDGRMYPHQAGYPGPRVGKLVPINPKDAR